MSWLSEMACRNLEPHSKHTWDSELVVYGPYRCPGVEASRPVVGGARMVGASSWVLDPDRAGGFIAAHDVARSRLDARLLRLGLWSPQVRAQTHVVQVGRRFLLVAVVPAVES